MWTRPFLVGTGKLETLGPEIAACEGIDLEHLLELAGSAGILVGRRTDGWEADTVSFLAGDMLCEDMLSGAGSEETPVPLERRRRDMTSPERLNYAFLFDEGDTEKEPMKSFAGRAYQLLAERDEIWIREIYGLGDMPAEEMASHLGVDIGELSSWNRVKVTFRDGDGTAVSGYSNAKEIISLASVYACFQGWDDYETFFQYADMLWRKSHSYRISVSDIYYCEGECQFTEKPSTEIEMEESLESESGDHESSLTEETEESPGDTGSEPGDLPQEETTARERDDLEVGPGIETTGDIQETGESEPESGTEAEDGEMTGEKVCQGHRDLDISVRITGLTETRSLYEIDSEGSLTENFSDQWDGWDTQARSYCDNLAEQDWYQLYGLSVSSSVYVRNPLSQSEIAFYLNKLPDTVSPKRRELVRQALLSVGCIPYYWGGKPTVGGFEGNHFGTVVEADEDGRILRGLDCSGWICWVYWTAFGTPVPAHSTSGLISCGQGIAKEELQAGDILVRTGEQPHVYLFLAWADDGSMYLIHETTGNVNNVTVNTYDVEVSHYRDLIGE